MINRSAIFQPTKWGNAYFKHLIEEEWVLLEEGPGGHNQVGNTIDSKSTSSANDTVTVARKCLFSRHDTRQFSSS